MERLTVPDVRVDEHTTRRSIIDGNAVREHAMEIYWRLKDYEDTGLMPAEVHSMYGEWCAMMSVLNGIGSYERLRELAEADKDERLVVLPCKVGNTVWANLDGMRHTRKCVIEFANIGSHVTTIVFSTVDGSE